MCHPRWAAGRDAAWRWAVVGRARIEARPCGLCGAVQRACTACCRRAWPFPGLQRLLPCARRRSCPAASAQPPPCMPAPQGTLLLNNVHKSPKAVLPLIKQTVDAVSRGSMEEGEGGWARASGIRG